MSNQIAWLCIGIASWRFRLAWVKQGRKIEELKFPNPLGGFAAPAVVVSVSVIILGRSFSCFARDQMPTLPPQCKDGLLSREGLTP